MRNTSLQFEQQIATLRREADKLKIKERPYVIGQIKQAIAYYGLTAGDLGVTRAVARPQGSKKASSEKATSGRVSTKGRKLGPVAVKYRDRAGNTWTGRGSQPIWLRDALAAGRKLSDFTV